MALAILGVLVAALVPVSAAPSLGSDWLNHGLAFSVLTLIAAWAFPRLALWRIGLCLAILGLSIEGAQALPMINRGASVVEAAWNGFVIFAVLITLALGEWRRSVQT